MSQTRLQSLDVVLGEVVEDLLDVRIAEHGKRHLAWGKGWRILGFKAE